MTPYSPSQRSFVCQPLSPEDSPKHKVIRDLERPASNQRKRDPTCHTRRPSRFPATPPQSKSHRCLKTVFSAWGLCWTLPDAASRDSPQSPIPIRGVGVKVSLRGALRIGCLGSAVVGFDQDPCYLHIQSLLCHDVLASSVTATPPGMVCASWGNRRFGARLPLSGCAVFSRRPHSSILFVPTPFQGWISSL